MDFDSLVSRATRIQEIEGYASLTGLSQRLRQLGADSRQADEAAEEVFVQLGFEGDGDFGDREDFGSDLGNAYTVDEPWGYD